MSRGGRRHRQAPDARLEQAMRRALHQFADAIEPAADGLERIEAKIAARRRAGWLARVTGQARGAARPAAHRRAGPGSRRAGLPAGAWAAAAGAGGALAEAARAVAGWLRPGPGPRAPLGWLRPAGALATDAIVVVVATLAITTLPQVISPSNNSATLGPGAPGGPAGPARLPASRSPGGSAARSATPAASPSPRCPSPARTRSRRPSHSPGMTPTPGPTPSPQPTPTLTPTPTPTTSSPASSDSASATPTLGASGQPAQVRTAAGARPARPRSRHHRRHCGTG